MSIDLAEIGRRYLAYDRARRAVVEYEQRGMKHGGWDDKAYLDLKRERSQARTKLGSAVQSWEARREVA